MKTAIALITIFTLFLGAHAEGREYKLSKRSVEELKKLNEHVKDAEARLKFGNAVLLIAPFQKLLSGPSADTVVDIGTTDWTVYGTASQGLAVHFRTQLKQFCEFEALKQRKSKDDYQFWLQLSRQFQAKGGNKKKIEDLNKQIASTKSQIAKKQQSFSPKRTAAVARQKALKREDERIGAWEQRGKAAWKKHQNEGKAILRLQQWIEDNLVTDDGTIDEDDQRYKDYVRRSSNWKKKDGELKQDAKKLRQAGAKNVAEAKSLRNLISEVNSLGKEIDTLKEKLKGLEKQLAVLK